MPVLIIEDEESLGSFFGAVLQSRGIEYEYVRSCEAAHAAIALRRPSLILTDLNLPGENGLEFVVGLKADSTLAEIPIVAITGNDLQWRRRTLLDAGCEDFLVKPVLIQSLLEVVRRFVPPAS